MRSITVGSTDQSVLLRFADATNGQPKTDLTHASAGLAIRYRRDGGQVVTVTPASLAAANSAHTDGGFVHLHQGWYRLDLPDAAFAAGASDVLVSGVADGAVNVVSAVIPLIGYEPSNASTLGLSRLALITTTTDLLVTSPISSDDVISVFKGKALADTLLYVPTSSIDLRGYNARFGATKLVAQSGDASFDIDVAIEDANVEDEQRIVLSLTKLKTSTLAVDDTVVFTTGAPSGRAYRYGVSVNNSHIGTLQAADTNTATLASGAASHVDGFYVGQTLEITSGDGIGSEREITGYVASTRVATLSGAWTGTTPDSSSEYKVHASDDGCRQIAVGEISVKASDTSCG